MRGEVITIKTASGVIITYVKALPMDKEKMNFEVQRRMRRRSFLHGVIVHTYHPEMDFTNTLAKGSTILYDYR